MQVEAEAIIDVHETTELTSEERADLLRYEAVIQRGLDTFLDVGRALMAIRNQRLYRATHATFDDYCRERWNISRKYAYRQINAAMVVDNLLVSPIGDIEDGDTVLPANEAQARPLSGLEPDQQREAWAKARELAGGGQPTAAQVEQAAAPFKPAPVWELERRVSEWLHEYIGESGLPTPDAVLDTLALQAGRAIEPDSWFDQLYRWIINEHNIQFRKRDLIQAINNVREQRRQTQRQDELKTSAPQVARAVYTESQQPESDPATGAKIWKDSGHTPTDLLAHGIIIEEAERNYFRWVDTNEASYREGALHDTPEQAVASARHVFGIHPDEAEEQPSAEEQEAMAAVAQEREEEAQDRLMPPDLYKAGYHFVKTSPQQWAVVREEQPEEYQSNRCFDPMDALEDLRTYLSRVTPDDLSAAGFVIVPVPKGWQWQRGTDHGDSWPLLAECIADARQRIEPAGTWSEGAVGLTRDWTQEELDDYAEAHEVVTPDTAAMPDDLAALGYELQNPRPGVWLWSINKPNVSFSGGPFATAELAIQGARNNAEMLKPRPVAESDPRLSEARQLRDLLIQARTRVNADYGRLCGKWVEILGWYRATEKMIRDLDSLIAILEGTANEQPDA